MRLESKKTRAILLIALFMISTLAVTIPVSAQVLTVGTGQTYPTITEALEVAVDGYIIQVYAGTYIEDLIIDVPNLGLVAVEEATIQLVDGVGIDIRGPASGFTLSGFTILAGTGTTFDIQLANAPSNVEISYNVIDTTGLASMGVSVGAAGSTGLTITNNEFTADDGDGSIAAWHGGDHIDVTVSNNVFTGTDSAYAVQFSPLASASITGNTISGYGMGVPVTGELGPATDVTISDNIISDCLNGILLGHPGVPDEDITGIIVERNILSSNGVGLFIDGDVGIAASTFTVKENDFLMTNTLCLDNDHSDTIDATLNWWETTDPGVIAGMVQGSVDYIPCLSQSAVGLTATVSGWILDLQYVGSGTVILNPVMPLLGYDAGTVVTLTAVPAANWKFVGWSGVLSGAVNPETITMDGDKTVTATFMLPTVSIIVDQPTVVLSGKIGSTTVDPETVTVSNDGNVIVYVTATLAGTDVDFFGRCLMIGEVVDPVWTSSTPGVLGWPYDVGPFTVAESKTLGLGLNLAGESVAGTYSATLVFEATPEPP